MQLAQKSGPFLNSAAASPTRTAADASPRRTPWKRLKRGCLRAFQTGLEASGLASLYVRWANVTGTTILMFHSVAGPEHARWMDPRFHMAPEVFERRMRFLASRRHPVSLTRLVQAMEEGVDLPPRSVVVTFDDGYLDHLTVAAPILAKHRIPATFFLPTGYVSRVENQWVDRLHSSFRRRTRHELLADGERFDLTRPDREREAFRKKESILLITTYSERIAHLRDVDEQLRPEGTAPRLTLDWKDVNALQNYAPDFEIGGHSQDHIDLGSNEGDVRRELAACADDLDRELGPASRHLSYPYERWTTAVKDEARRQGFRSACGAGSGFLVTAQSDRFALPRLDPQKLRSAFGYATSGAHPGLSLALTGRA